MTPDTEKRLAAEAAAELVESGMTVGLGTGSTVAHLLPAIGRRGLTDLRGLTPPPSLPPSPKRRGTDEVTPDGWLIKGGGGAHLREKIVAAAAARFVVIADSSKPVEAFTWPIPLELYAFGLASTLARLGPDVTVREGAPPSPDGGVIADYRGPGREDPASLMVRLEGDPGVAAQGLFPPSLVSDLFVATDDVVSHTRFP